MNQTAIFWPMLAHVLLVYLIYGLMARRRFGAVGSGAAKPSQFKGRLSEPEQSVTVANNLMNQFEAPVLFYALCLALYATHGVNYLTLILAWLFIVSRYVHAWIHTTSNDLALRHRAFAFGLLVLAIDWIWFALHIAGMV